MKYKNLALYGIIGVMAFSMSILLTGCDNLFTTGGGGDGDNDIAPIVDVIAPTVINTVPANEVTDVYIDRKITATFSEAMWPATIDGTAFTVVKTDGLVPVDGTVDYDETNHIAIFTPTDVLETDTEYTATMDNEVTDLAWNPMATDKVWTFTTGADIDDVAPTVISTVPANLDINVAVNGNISATFSEVMDSTTITTATFTVRRTGGEFPIPGAVTYVSKTAVFNPTYNLRLDTQYTATITTVVEDMAGNALATNKVWTFTTEEVAGTSIANPQAPVMGETGRFVILASQSVTTTDVTAISGGDMGILDQARTYYTGFTPGVNPGEFDELTGGLSYAHSDTDPALIPAGYASTIAFLNQVRTDLGNAYTFLAADPNPAAPTQVCPIELGALTLTPGVYKTDANVTIQTGDLTLDAQGDATSVWIFSIGGKLTTGDPGGDIVLTGGALPGNVYWRVAGVTAIGAGTTFQGNVFGWEQVNVVDGAKVENGRLFSVIEQVTLIGNTVTKP